MAECDVESILAEAGCLGCYNEHDLLVIQAQLLCNVATSFDPANFVPYNNPGTTFTEGSVLFVGNNGGATEDNDRFFWNDTQNSLRLGTRDSVINPDATMHKQFSSILTVNAPSKNYSSIFGEFTATGVNSGNRQGMAYNGYAEVDAGATLHSLWCASLTATVQGTATFCTGVNCVASIEGTIVTRIVGGQFYSVGVSGTCPDIMGGRFGTIIVGGTYTNSYAGLFETESGGTITNRYGIWVTLNHASAIGHVIKLAATPTGDAFRVISSASAVLTAITSAGAIQSQGLQVVSTGSIAFSSGAIGAASDVIFTRTAAAKAGLINSTTAQTFEVYGTFVDATNYSRLVAGLFDGSSHSFAVQGAGANANRNLNFGTVGTGTVGVFTNNTIRWTFTGADLVATGNGGINIGGSAAINKISKVLQGSAVIDPASVAAQTLAALGTITITGAVAGDTVFLGIPSTWANTNMVIKWSVTAADTITIYGYNPNAVTAIDLPSATIKAFVHQQ